MKRIITLQMFTALLFFNAYSQNFVETELFKIDITRDTIVTTSKGSKIEIPAYSIDIEGLEDDIESVNFRIEEAFETNEMVISNLSTETTKNLLLSDGMIKVEAEYRNKPLNLFSDKQITISLPTTAGIDTQMNLYTQDTNRESWVKQNEKLRFDTCKMEIKRIIWDYQKSSKKEYKKWKKETPDKNKPQPRLFGGKEINLFSFKKKEYFIPIPVDTIWGCIPMDTAYYRFNIKSLGWYNIDKLARVKKPVSVKVKTKLEGEVKVHLVVKNKKVCLKGKKRNGAYYFRRLNKNTRIVIVCYKQLTKDEVSFSIKEMKLSENTTVEIEDFNVTSLASFKKRIKNAL